MAKVPKQYNLQKGHVTGLGYEKHILITWFPSLKRTSRTVLLENLTCIAWILPLY